MWQYGKYNIRDLQYTYINVHIQKKDSGGISVSQLFSDKYLQNCPVHEPQIDIDKVSMIKSAAVKIRITKDGKGP